jgi:DnaJ domain
MKDYYAILGVREEASQVEIKRAYRMMAFQYHPDENPGADAEALIKEINEAYDTLSDVDKKVVYDQRRHNPLRDIAVDEPVKRHRDPRYRSQNPRPLEKPAYYALIERWHKYVIWINAISVIVFLLLTLDYVMPYKTSDEVMKLIHASYSARGGFQNYIVTTESGKRFKAYRLASSNVGDTITVVQTRIYGIVMKMSSHPEQIEQKMGYIYGPLMIMPIALFISGGVGIMNRKKLISSFNCGVVSAILLIITLVLIY